MRLNNFIFALRTDGILVEGAKARSAGMVAFLDTLRMHLPSDTPPAGDHLNLEAATYETIAGINGALDTAKETFMQWVVWANKTFVTPQQVAWFLRIARVGVLYQAVNQANGAVSKSRNSQIRQMDATHEIYRHLGLISNALHRYATADVSLMPAEPGENPFDGAINAARTAFTRDFALKMEHFFSQGIPEIDAYNPERKPLKTVEYKLAAIEKEFRAKFGNIIQTRPDDPNPPTILIRYPDGSAWMDLNVRYCDAEAKAMGHCGNTGSRDSDETVLSYRTAVPGRNGVVHWSPHLTFILNRRTGMLGEMKGRQNAKPVARYHAAIKDLLKLPMIKGIVGGGYMPQNNFSMADLPGEESEAMIKDKPELADLKTHVRMNGGKMNAKIMKRVHAIYDEFGNSTYPEYDRKTNKMIVEKYSDLDDALIGVFGEKSLMYTYLKREGSFSDHWDFWAGINDENCLDVMENFPAYLLDAIRAYTKAEHSHRYAEVEEDEGKVDDRDLFRILDDRDDEVITTIKQGVETGMRYGAEAEAYEAAKSHLHHFDKDGNFDIVMSSENMDAPTWVTCDPDFFVENIADFAEYGLSNFREGREFRDLIEPQYGWSDYDEEAAVDSARANVEENIDDKYFDKKVRDAYWKKERAQAEAKRKAAEKAAKGKKK